jgi:LPXTG-motif cell wall-anchored protein
MSGNKILAIVLIVAGLLGVMYGKFSYTKETHQAKLGPIEMSVKEKQTVNVPVWAGVAAIAAGAGLLLVRTKR